MGKKLDRLLAHHPAARALIAKTVKRPVTDAEIMELVQALEGPSALEIIGKFLGAAAKLGLILP